MKYSDESWTGREERAIEYALDKVRRDFDQGWQGIEYKLNTVGSSRGDYPFVTVTLGLGIKQFEKMASISLLEVHKGGQGKAGRTTSHRTYNLSILLVHTGNISSSVRSASSLIRFRKTSTFSSSKESPAASLCPPNFVNNSLQRLISANIS